jgi:hypothetical protein
MKHGDISMLCNGIHAISKNVTIHCDGHKIDTVIKMCCDTR